MNAPTRQDDRPARPPVTEHEDDLIGIAEVEVRTSCSRRTIYRMVAAGKFPKARQITESRVGWRRGDVQEWCRTRPESVGVSLGVSGNAA